MREVEKIATRIAENCAGPEIRGPSSRHGGARRCRAGALGSPRVGRVQSFSFQNGIPDEDSRPHPGASEPDLEPVTSGVSASNVRIDLTWKQITR